MRLNHTKVVYLKLSGRPWSTFPHARGRYCDTAPKAVVWAESNFVDRFSRNQRKIDKNRKLRLYLPDSMIFGCQVPLLT